MSLMPRKAMVLAAGLGTRMRPLTDTIPKPLVPVAGVTLIDRILDWVSASGIDDVVINSHYRADQLKSHLASRHRPQIQVTYEETVLETGGGIKNALPLLGSDPFLSLNSDVLCIDGSESTIERLGSHWNDRTMDALLLVHPTHKAIGYTGPGDFLVDDKGSIRRRGDAASAPYTFTGVQILHPRFFAQAPEGAFSMNLLYNHDIAADGTLKRVVAVVHDGDWLHIGDVEGLRAAEAFLAR